MFTTDAHCDTLSNIAVWGEKPETCAVTPEKLRAGNVCLQTYAMFAGTDKSPGTLEWRGKVMLAAAEKLLVPILRGKLPEPPPETPHAILSIEGGELFFGDIARFESYADQGVKLAALTWNYENEIGYPAMGGTQNGLKPFGKALLRAMDARGVMADTSHLNEAGFFDVAENARLPMVASHSNLRALCDVPRNLTKAQVKTIIDKQGFIGINFYADFLAKDRAATLEDVYRHMEGILELGGEKALGFGSDFDGIERWPEGLSDPSCLPALIEGMLRRNWAEELVKDIAGMNFWNTLKRAEAACA